MKHPGGYAAINAKDSHAAIALKTAEKAAELETYHTQEGMEAGLKDLIVSKVQNLASIYPLPDYRKRSENIGNTGILR